MSIIKLARALTSSAVIAGLIVSIKYLNDKYIQMEEDAEKEAKEKFEKTTGKNFNVEKGSDALKKTVKNKKALSPEDFLNSKDNTSTASDKFEFPKSSDVESLNKSTAIVAKKTAVKKPVARKTKVTPTKVESASQPAVKKATKVVAKKAATKTATPRKAVAKTDTPASDSTPKV